MTRPALVRADTIDLQNQDAPTTQDHATQALGPSDVGKHQASEIRHVVQERHSEEENLHDAWNRANDEMEVQELTDDQLQAHQHENGDSADESDMDDDMLDDRISSSPSIDDGAYPPAAAAAAASSWPTRSSSLTPPRQTLNCSAASTPDSSPFVNSPAHLPLSVLSVTDLSDSPASSAQSSSPFLQYPQHLPLSASPLSKHHHHAGEYNGGYLNNYTQDFHSHRLDDDDLDSDLKELDNDIAAPSTSTTSLVRGHTVPWGKSVEDLTTTGAEEHSPDNEDDDDLFLPENDPLLEKCLSPRSASPSSWSTVSDASITSDPDDGHLRTNNDDDEQDLSFYSDDRFVDSGWGGECLRETEDIDFDFVYALHTFVATVEGQANAAKGDTMVLLDDSNSYWWLVRIVKDNSIGYLPAEHIETPTERLARLNKHRNVDLSAAMLGDSAEKSKNPLKKAMKRRNAKTVQFTAPTFVEASDYDYSSDEEDGMMPEPLYTSNNQQGQAEVVSDTKSADHEEPASDITTTVVEVARTDTPELTSPAGDIKAPAEEPLSSPTLVDRTEAAPLKSSRKGTPRNADSFLKDDGAEPRKITLTPNLLRDDSGGGRSLDNAGSSMESLEKSTSPPDKPKDDKKKKDKKPGMLSGLFKSKKKDKKHKNSVDEDSDMEKISGELARQTSSDSPKGSPVERSSQFTGPEPKSRGRLQKPQSGATAASPVANHSIAPAPAAVSPVVAPAPLRRKEAEKPKSFVAELEGSTVDAPTTRDVEQFRQQETRAAGDTLLGSTTLSSITHKIRPSESQDNLKPKKVKKAKTRVELDDFDEVSEEEDHRENQAPEADPTMTNAFMHGTEMVHIPMNLGDDSSSPDENDTNEERGGEESSDRSSSPSMIDTPKASLEREREDQQHQNGYIQDMTDDDPTPVASKRQSAMVSGASTPQAPQANPPLRQAPSPPQRASSATPSVSSSTRLSPSPASTRSPASTTGTANTWSDVSLRAWLDGAENDVRDMLVIIHDKSAVVPVARDHPLMADLFTSESRRLAGLQDELDSLLGNWLARKKGAREVATS